MEAGFTFTMVALDQHLWVVLSDPVKDPENVLLVNLTTLGPRKEQACVLTHNDHPWVRHPTCVNYGDAVVTTLAKLRDAKNGGAITLQDPVSAALLQRMREGALASERMSLDNADILINQGLIDA